MEIQSISSGRGTRKCMHFLYRKYFQYFLVLNRQVLNNNDTMVNAINLETTVMELVEKAIEGIDGYDNMIRAGNKVVEGIEGVYGCSPFEVLGRLVRIRDAKKKLVDMEKTGRLRRVELPKIIQEQDQDSFDRGYRLSVDQESIQETAYGKIRTISEGIWGGPECLAEVIEDKKSKTVRLDWYVAGKLLEKIRDGTVTEVRIDPHN